MIRLRLLLALEALGKVFRAVFQGKKLFLLESRQERRWSACKRCDFYLSEGLQCGVCSCFLPLKVPLVTETCPKGYWIKYALTNSGFGKLIQKLCHKTLAVISIVFRLIQVTRLEQFPPQTFPRAVSSRETGRSETIVKPKTSSAHCKWPVVSKIRKTHESKQKLMLNSRIVHARLKPRA